MSIEIRGLNIAIGTKPIVRDVCMGIADGERVGLARFLRVGQIHDRQGPDGVAARYGTDKRFDHGRRQTS